MPETFRSVPPLRPSGPDVVALGGGYGLSTTLRAARRFARTVTGVVSVADDGGSSGRLRKAFGIPAPGDLRRCLVALAEDGSVWADAFEHRFTASELEGHPLGNLVIAGLTESLGSFGAAIDESLRLLGGVGRVIPATDEPVTLRGTFRRPGNDDVGDHVVGVVEGEARVGRTAGLTRVSLVPPDPAVPPEALASIRAAGLLCIGPGSLFTSILAVLAVPSIRDAVAESRGTRVYVANLMEQHPETSGFDVADHLAVLAAHGIRVDVLVHDPAGLALGDVASVDRAVRVLEAPLAAPGGRLHDESLLAAALGSLA